MNSQTLSTYALLTFLPIDRVLGIRRNVSTTILTRGLTGSHRFRNKLSLFERCAFVSNPVPNGPQFDGPGQYRIYCKGVLPRSYSDRLGGMTISMAGRPGDQPITALTGWLPDQAALLGVLNVLYELHLPLLSVECVEA